MEMETAMAWEDGNCQLAATGVKILTEYHALYAMCPGARWLAVTLLIDRYAMPKPISGTAAVFKSPLFYPSLSTDSPFVRKHVIG